jgi:hypothetical protein
MLYVLIRQAVTNTAVGSLALDANTTANENTALGYASVIY